MTRSIKFPPDESAFAELVNSSIGECPPPEPNPQLEELCEKIEASNECLEELKGLLNLPDLSGYQPLGCVVEGEGKDAVVLGRVGVCKAGTPEEPVFIRVYFPKDGEPVLNYDGLVSDCPVPAEYIDSGCEVIDVSDPLCGQPVLFCEATPGIAYVFNPATFEIEEIDMAKVGKNPTENNTCVYPFQCEIIGDGTTATTPATIIAAQAGGVFPGTTLPADDAATVHLSQYEITLGHQGDEAEGTAHDGCDAIYTATETSKEVNMEPGGSVGATVPAGVSVPDFSVVPSADSVIRVCGELTIQKAKDGTAIAKSAK